MIERRRWLRLALRGTAAAAGSGLLAGGLAGCSGRLLDGPAPHEAAWAKPSPVAWVFSSGGPRAFVHIGVLRGLAELGLMPDFVIGASGGAIAAALCGAGLKPEQMQRLAMDLQPTAVVRLSITQPGRLSAAGLAEWVRDQVEPALGSQPVHAARAGVVFERLPMRAACVAYRPRDGRLVAFNRGDVGAAVAASCAIEGRFAPVTIAGEAYVDPDLHMPMPVRLARRLGARKVLAVDASAHDGSAPAGASSEWLAGDRRKRELTAPDARAADVVLHPRLPYYAGISTDYRAAVIEIGYRETLQRAAPLRALHAA